MNTITHCPKCGNKLGPGVSRCWTTRCDFTVPPGTKVVDDGKPAKTEMPDQIKEYKSYKETTSTLKYKITKAWRSLKCLCELHDNDDKSGTLRCTHCGKTRYDPPRVVAFFNCLIGKHSFTQAIGGGYYCHYCRKKPRIKSYSELKYKYHQIQDRCNCLIGRHSWSKNTDGAPDCSICHKPLSSLSQPRLARLLWTDDSHSHYRAGMAMTALDNPAQLAKIAQSYPAESIRIAAISKITDVALLKALLTKRDAGGDEHDAVSQRLFQLGGNDPEILKTLVCNCRDGLVADPAFAQLKALRHLTQEDLVQIASSAYFTIADEVIPMIREQRHLADVAIANPSSTRAFNLVTDMEEMARVAIFSQWANSTPALRKLIENNAINILLQQALRQIPAVEAPGPEWQVVTTDAAASQINHAIAHYGNTRGYTGISKGALSIVMIYSDGDTQSGNSYYTYMTDIKLYRLHNGCALLVKHEKTWHPAEW